MSHLWSDRFSSAPDADVFEYGKSLSVDRRLIEDDLTGSRAWVGALARAGVVSAADAAAIVSGLEAIRNDVGVRPELLRDAPDEDVHSFVERELVLRVG